MSILDRLIQDFVPPPAPKKPKPIASSGWFWWLRPSWEHPAGVPAKTIPVVARTVDDWIHLVRHFGARRYRIYEPESGVVIIHVPKQFVSDLRVAVTWCAPLGVRVRVNSL